MKQNGYENLGFYSIGMIYLMTSVCSFFNAPVVNRLGAKYSIFWGAISFLFWVLSSLIPALKAEVYPDSELFLFKDWFVYMIMLTSGGINGLGASILWVGQGKYIASCANEDNKGRFFSLFWFIFMIAFIIGNQIDAVIIASLSLVAFYIVMSAFCLTGSLTILLLKAPKNAESIIVPQTVKRTPANEENLEL